MDRKTREERKKKSCWRWSFCEAPRDLVRLFCLRLLCLLRSATSWTLIEHIATCSATLALCTNHSDRGENKGKNRPALQPLPIPQKIVKYERGYKRREKKGKEKKKECIIVPKSLASFLRTVFVSIRRSASTLSTRVQKKKNFFVKEAVMLRDCGLRCFPMSDAHREMVMLIAICCHIWLEVKVD